MNHTAHSERLSEGVAFSGCNMRVLWQSNHIKSRARPASVTLNWEAVMAIRKRATRRTKAKRKKTLVTKTATPIKTKTVRKNKRAMNGSPLPAPQLITGEARVLPGRGYPSRGYRRHRGSAPSWHSARRSLRSAVKSQTSGSPMRWRPLNAPPIFPLRGGVVGKVRRVERRHGFH
jgi:hypothetical protein